MKSRAWLFAAAMSAAGLVLAQNAPKTGVSESTDPAKIAEIEQHAQRLAGSQSAMPAADQHEPMRKHMTRKHKPKHKPAMKDKAPSHTPMAPDSKG